MANTNPIVTAKQSRYPETCTKQYETKHSTCWTWGKYEIITYPDSESFMVRLREKTHRRVYGRVLLAAARAALDAAKQVQP